MRFFLTNISQTYGTMNPSCREAIKNLLLLVLGNFAELWCLSDEPQSKKRLEKRLLKNANLLIIATNDQIKSYTLNSQFTAVLNIIICFSARFSNNSLLLLKMHFRVFSFANKKLQGCSSDRKMLLLLQSVLFHLQNRVHFWSFNFYPSYLEKCSICPWNQPHFLRNSDKSLLSRELSKLKEIWDMIV